MTQTARVLRALKRHPEGLTRVDFMLPNVVDGGRPILNFPARIKNLKEDGHEIVDGGERYGCKVYKLARPEPVQIPRSEVPEISSEDRLFAPPAANAIYGDEAA